MFGRVIRLLNVVWIGIVLFYAIFAANVLFMVRMAPEMLPYRTDWLQIFINAYTPFMILYTEFMIAANVLTLMRFWPRVTK